MSIRLIFTVVVAVAFVIGSYAVFLPVQYNSNASTNSAAAFADPVSTWSGILTIYPNGSLSNPAAPVLQTGNYYNLTGNINGSILIERTGAILNGEGYNVSNPVASTIQLIEANNITVLNTHIYALWSNGIKVYDSSFDTIFNNTINGMNSGIFIYSPYNLVENNTLILNLTAPLYNGNPAGIVVDASGNSVLNNSITIPISSTGIIAESDGSVYENNTLFLNGSASYGFSVTGGHNTMSANSIQISGDTSYGMNLVAGAQSNSIYSNSINITGNHSRDVNVADGLNAITGNTLKTEGNWDFGVYVISSGTGQNIISENNVTATGSNVSGVFTYSFSTSIVSNSLLIMGNTSYGVDALAQSDILSNSIVINGSDAKAVYLAAVNSNISGNIINVTGDYTYGIDAVQVSSMAVNQNTVVVEGNHVNGTYISGTNISLRFNDIAAGYMNGTSLYLYETVHSLFYGNNISASSTGLRESLSTANTFNGNSFYNDTVLFRFSKSASNLYFHNNFVNYTSLFISGSSLSVWDNGYPSGGNYWSAYTGVDLFSGPQQNISGSDGIGDTPYTVFGNNIDNYPLMVPWTFPGMIFVESGLESGTTWSVTLNGVTTSSTSSQVSFSLENGVFMQLSYSVTNVSGYTVTPLTGELSYTGHSIATQVTFTLIPVPPPPPPPPLEHYSVLFSENGLPDGTSWTVTFNASEKTSTTASVSFTAPNGTYAYSVHSVPGYSHEILPGSITVNGGTAHVSVTYTVLTYTVTFNDIGLPAGTEWYVNLSGGHSLSTKESSMTVNLPNGTYSYSVGSISGYNITPDKGSVSVAGASPNPVTVSFSVNNTTPAHTSGGSTPLPYWVYILIGILVGAGGSIAGMAVYYRRR